MLPVGGDLKSLSSSTTCCIDRHQLPPAPLTEQESPEGKEEAGEANSQLFGTFQRQLRALKFSLCTMIL